MSIVPNDALISSDSLDLITFGIELIVDSAEQRIDTYSRLRSYWKKAVIRNNQAGDVLTFYTSTNGIAKTVNPNSELPLGGWGSYLRIESNAIIPKGRVDFECVRLENALRKPNNAN